MVVCQCVLYGKGVWAIYKRELYDALRSKYHAETLPNIYDKIKPGEAGRPVSRWKGFSKGMLGINTLSVKCKDVRQHSQRYER